MTNLRRLSARGVRLVVWAVALVVIPGVQWVSAAVLSEWTFRNPVPSNADLYNGVFGNGVYVLVGRGTGVHRTSDLHNWTSDYPGAEVENVIFAEGMFTISGNSGQILRSTDAAVWTRYETGLDAPLYGLTFSGDRYVAVGDGGVTATSVNGTDWTTSSIGDGNLYWSVAAGEGRFVAVSGQGTLATSTDGTTWSEASLGAGVPGYIELYVVAYGAGRFVAGGYFWDELTSNEGAVVLSSEDGLAWSLVTDPNIPQDATNPENNQYWIDEIKYDGSQFVAAGDSGLLLVSADGLTWSTRFPNTTRDFLGLAFGPAETVVFGRGGNYFFSQDLIGWEVGNPDIGLGLGRWEAIAHNGNQYLLAGLLGLVAHSDDGVSWSGEHRGGATGTYSDATYGNGLWVATSLQNSDGVCVVTSSDGVEWVRPTLPAGVQRCGGVAFGNGTFVATVSAASPIVVKSADGSDWSAVNLPAGSGLRGVEFGGGQFVAWSLLGSGDPASPVQVLTSSDGATWEAHDTPLTSTLLQAAAYGDGRWVFVGGDGGVLTTTDFTQWEQQQLAFGDRDPDWLEGIAYGNGHWVIVGRQHAVWSSTDGLVWQNAFTTGMTFAADTFYDVVFDGSYFWLCGNGGVLLQSQLVEGGGTTPGPANLAVRIGGDPGTLVLTLQGRQGDPWDLEYSPTLSPAANWELRQSVTLADGTAEVIEIKNAGGFYRLKSPAGP